MSVSPTLPWEVIERVIEHSVGRTQTLYNFALTCRDLRPRSTIVLLRHVKFKTRSQIFDLCDVLQVKPHLQPSVRSVSILVNEFSPHKLLRILPHLSEIELYSVRDNKSPKDALFHSSVLRCCHPLGKHIQSLSLRSITFRLPSDLSAILLSFPRIQSLSCMNVETRAYDGVVREELITRLSERLHLRTLTIHECDNGVVVKLLIDATRRKLASLTFVAEYFDSQYAYFDQSLKNSHSDWVQLTSLTWKVHLTTRNASYQSQIERIIGVLHHFLPTNLQEVTVAIDYDTLQDLVIGVLPSVAELCPHLEETLLTFSTPTISFSSSDEPKALNGRRSHSWMDMLSGFFPLLAGRRALRIDAEPSWNLGHDGRIWTPVVTSADSRWAVTGAQDNTIIIWDLENQCISQEWFIEDSKPSVNYLSFSPDSKYIISVHSIPNEMGRGREVTIWDIRQGGSQVRSFTGRSPLYTKTCSDIRCAWSPDGTWVAAGPRADGNTHIWDTTTFQPLPRKELKTSLATTTQPSSSSPGLARWHAGGTVSGFSVPYRVPGMQSDATWKGGLLASSADGHWVITAVKSGTSNCWIWDAESGQLYRDLKGHTRSVCAAAFNLDGTRVVTGSADSTIRIWDVETGEGLLVLEEQATRLIDAVVFSGDGGMVLSCARVVPMKDDTGSLWSRTQMVVYETSSPSRDDESGGAKVWDASSGALLASLSRSRSDKDSTPYIACFSPCGSYIASASDGGNVLLWRTSDWSCVAEVSGGGARMSHVAISPDGKVLCCGTEAGTVLFRHMHDIISAT